MGGYNSGGHNREHITAETCAQIDAAMLRRAGLILPSEPKSWQTSYNRRGITVLVLNVTAIPEAPEALHFSFTVPGQGTYSQIVPMSFTPCHYGKERAWLHCPKCQQRVFRLFYYDNTVGASRQPVHYLACRHCYGLTYDLRRERGFDYYQSQVIKIGEKLKHYAAKHRDWQYLKDTQHWSWGYLPRKPKGMRQKTYDWLASKFRKAWTQSRTCYAAALTSLLGQEETTERSTDKRHGAPV